MIDITKFGNGDHREYRHTSLNQRQKKIGHIVIATT